MSIGDLGMQIFNAYNSFLSSLPLFAQTFINLFLIVVLIFIYSVFIWKLYRVLAKKNVIELNLNKYNTSEHRVLAKTLAVIFYFIEYIIVMPLLIFLGFSIFTLFLIFLTENLAIGALLIISAAIIAAIRMTAYYHEDLSRDLAKLFPFTLLAVSVLNPNFFSVERIFSRFQEIPTFFNEIFIYLIFIIALEVILRIVDSIFSLFGSGQEENGDDEKQNQVLLKKINEN